MAGPVAKLGKLGRALGALARALDASGYPWMCIGGIAAIAQGVRRTTTDVDVAMRAEGIDIDAFIETLSRRRIRARIPNAARFARESQVLLLEHVPSGVSLDLSFAWLSFEHEALAEALTIDFAGVAMRAARPEDLIIYKLFAGRPQDLIDAESLLLLHRSAIDLERVRRTLKQLAAITEQSDVVPRLDALLPKPVERRAKARGGPRR